MRQFENMPLGLTRQIVYLIELLEIASEEHTHTRSLNGLPPLNDIGRWEDMHSMREMVRGQNGR